MLLDLAKCHKTMTANKWVCLLLM